MLVGSLENAHCSFIFHCTWYKVTYFDNSVFDRWIFLPVLAGEKVVGKGAYSW
jgi:hypothetical protein